MLQLPEPQSPLPGSDVLFSVRGCNAGLQKVQQALLALLGKLGAHTSLPLVWLWAVRFLSREEDQHFDIQPRGLGEVSSLVLGFSATLQVQNN